MMNQQAKNWKTRFDELVGTLRDDSLSEEQSAELQTILDSQPGSRRRFAESMHLTAMLGDGA